MKRIEVLALDRPKVSLGLFTKSFSAVIGGFIAVIGILMMLTIILLLPGLGLFMFGTLLAYGSMPKVKAECPACGLVVKAKMNAKNVKCDHCETTTPIRWNNEGASKWTSWSAWKKKKPGA